MQETVANHVRVSFTGPATLPMSVVLRDSPAYDAERTFFTVALKNESGRRLMAPLAELQRSVVLVYRDRATGAEIVDNKTPPPPARSTGTEIAPGATHPFQVVFAYPATIATVDDGVAVVDFCVRWDATWLRASAYRRGEIDWNESFELCREVRIVQD